MTHADNGQKAPMLQKKVYKLPIKNQQLEVGDKARSSQSEKDLMKRWGKEKNGRTHSSSVQPKPTLEDIEETPGESDPLSERLDQPNPGSDRLNLDSLDQPNTGGDWLNPGLDQPSKEGGDWHRLSLDQPSKEGSYRQEGLDQAHGAGDWPDLESQRVETLANLDNDLDYVDAEESQNKSYIDIEAPGRRYHERESQARSTPVVRAMSRTYSKRRV